MFNIIYNADFSNGLAAWSLQEEPEARLLKNNENKTICLVSRRSKKWASVAQDITQQVREWGCGDYHISALVRPAGTTIGNIQLVVRAVLDGQVRWFFAGAEAWEAGFSTVEGVVTILWKRSVDAVSIYFQSSGEELFDFYCTDISMSKINGIKSTAYEDYFRDMPARDVYAGRNEKPLIGAIRWDAWLNPDLPTFTAPGSSHEDYIGAQMKRSLSPTQYHFRLPWFGKVLSAEEVTLPDYTQEIFDREQLWAREAGIDYWCYCWYKDDSGMDMARKFHVASQYKNLVSMCCMMSENDFKNPAYMIEQMQQDIWTRVDNGRPLVFLHAMSGKAPALESVEGFRQACKDAGLNDPWILGMSNFGISTALVKSLSLEGISDYAIGLGGASPYRSLMETVESRWDVYRASGVNVVPCVMTGWDRRPRIDHPVSWEGPTADKNGWVATASAEEIGEHLFNALEWNRENPGYTPLNAVLIYAWNEHDEGGWLCPTILDDDRDGLPEKLPGGGNKPDMRRLEAIRKVIKGV